MSYGVFRRYPYAVYGGKSQPWVATKAVAGAFSITAESGVYDITGSTVAFINPRQLQASAGAYTLTGTDAVLGYTTPLVEGSYDVTGSAITFGRGLVLDSGSYALNGSNVNLIGAHSIIADPGSYVITGTAAALLKNSASVIIADPGAYSINGQVVNLSSSAPASGGGAYTVEIARRRRR